MSGNGGAGNTPNSSSDAALDLLNRACSILRNQPASTEQVSTPHSNVTPRSSFQQQQLLTTPVTRPAQPSVLTELRQTFGRYDRNLPRGRNAGRPGREFVQSPWSHRMCCLAGPNENRTPSAAGLALLHENQLGHTTVLSHKGASSDELREAIEAAFPRLRNIPFEMLVAIGGGPGHGKQLRRIYNQLGVLSVACITQARVQATIYLRPSEQLIQEDQSSASESNLSELAENQEATRRTSDDEQHSGSIPEGVVDPPAGLLTIADLQNTVYAENPGQQIIPVQRLEFASEVLGVYKPSQFCLAQKPMVMFIGEQGRDVGALTKEYCWEGIIALSNGFMDGLPLFEGEADHKLPTCDSILLRAGHFYSLGKFIGHSLLHTGIGFVGLSSAVTDYLLTDSHLEKPFTIGKEDIADYSIRQILGHIDSWIAGAPPSESDLLSINTFARESNVNIRIEVNNLNFLKQELLYFHVIERRRPQLEAIKQGFRMSPAAQFVTERLYLHKSSFPKFTEIETPCQSILDKLSIEGDNTGTYETYMTEFIVETSTEPNGLRNLLLSWTGWPILTNEKLKVQVVDGGQFKVQTCFAQIEIPDTMSRDDFQQHMKMAIRFGTAGFGSV